MRLQASIPPAAGPYTGRVSDSDVGIAEPVASGAELVRFVECPRDAWQGLPRQIPARRKRRHLRLLIEAGFRHLDLASFVSPSAVPQMADSEAVLAQLERPPGVDFLAVVVNERGFERALTAANIASVGYPLSVNDTFQRRNSGHSLADSWPLLAGLFARATAGGLRFQVYLSMGFGNPYGEPWRPGDTAAAVERLRGSGVNQSVMADTVGRADAGAVADVLASVDRVADLGLHLHARPDGWTDTLTVALERGVRWFEGALSGIGGCPFAGDALVGNLPSETVIPWLRSQGLEVAAPYEALPAAAADAAEIAASYGPPGPDGARRCGE